MNNMRRAFTMIELIFVIVIIGILAAVALPKLKGVKQQAHFAKAGEFVGQLNSTVLPNLYSRAVMKGVNENGDYKAIKNLSPLPVFEDLIDMPANFKLKGANITTNMALANVTGAATPVLENTANNVFIYCRDGNETEMPRCWYSDKSAVTSAATDFNNSRASF